MMERGQEKGREALLEGSELGTPSRKREPWGRGSWAPSVTSGPQDCANTWLHWSLYSPIPHLYVPCLPPGANGQKRLITVTAKGL